MIVTTQLHTRIIVAALIIYAFALSIIDMNAAVMLGFFHLGSSMIKNDFLNFAPVTALISKAPANISKIPVI